VLGWDRWVRRRRDPAARPARAGPLFALSVLGLLTHPSLDWLNTYGMRWGLPFDGSWSYGDALFIVDPWIWLALGSAVLLSSDPSGRGMLGWAVLALLTSALVVVGIGGPVAVAWTVCVVGVALLRARFGAPAPHGRSALPRAALLATAGYIGLMVAADVQARADAYEAALASGLQVRDVMVAPLRGTPLRASVEVRTDDGYVPGTHEWLRDPRTMLHPERTLPALSAPGVPSATINSIVDAAGQRESVRNYLVWSRFPYVQVESVADGWSVFFGDARYDSQPEAGGLAGLRVRVTPADIQ